MDNFWWAMQNRGVVEASSLSYVREFGYHHLFDYRLARLGSECDYSLMWITLGGNPAVWHGPRQVHPTRGSITLFLAGEDHNCRADSWEAYWCRFHPSKGLLDNLKAYGVESGRTFDTVLADVELERISEIFALPNFSDDIAFHRYAVFVERSILCCLRGAASSVTRPSRMRLEDAALYIRQNPGADHRVEILARMANLSPSRFAHVFREENGVSVHTFVREVRMQRARHLLASSEMTAAQIGARLGYASAYHFYAVFKQVVGVAPIQYRRIHRNPSRTTSKPLTID